VEHKKRKRRKNAGLRSYSCAFRASCVRSLRSLTCKISSLMEHGKSTDPYRIFFPLGIMLGVMGVAIWPLYYFGVTGGYSGRAHAFVQTSGFLYAFIAGFLLTAIPRFTGTEAPSRRVQYALASIVTLSAVAFELQFFVIGQTGFLIAHLTLIALAARRYARRQQNPPETFPLAGLGLMSGTLGALINAGMAWNLVAPSWDLLGKRLLTEGMVLLLVLGVGGFLGPRLLGFAQLPQFTKLGLAIPAANMRRILLYKVAGLSVLSSLIAEYGFGMFFMAFVRAAVATVVIMSTIQPWRRPSTRTRCSECR